MSEVGGAYSALGPTGAIEIIEEVKVTDEIEEGLLEPEVAEVPEADSCGTRLSDTLQEVEFVIAEDEMIGLYRGLANKMILIGLVLNKMT